ncbi:MAG: hypothetical protein Q9227_004576 [Pyrenula ochraceoflavens]
MTAPYDEIAPRYDEDMKKMPQERCMDYHFTKTVGNVSNFRILDLAAGTGCSARILLSQGAREVVGLDLSPEMIAKAKEETKDDPRLHFFVSDCKEPISFTSEFDMVTGAWLFPFAANEEELAQMWKNIAQALKPGSRYVGITSNVRVDTHEDRLTNPKYGSTTEVLEKVPGGVKVMATMHTNPPIKFVAYSLRPDVYEKCALAAGMEDLRLEAPTWETLPADLDHSWWQEFLDKPNYVVVSAKRRAST